MRKGASASEGLTILLIDLRQQGRELTQPDGKSDLQHILEQQAVVHHVPWTGDIPKKIAETAAQVFFSNTIILTLPGFHSSSRLSSTIPPSLLS